MVGFLFCHPEPLFVILNLIQDPYIIDSRLRGNDNEGVKMTIVICVLRLVWNLGFVFLKFTLKGCL